MLDYWAFHDDGPVQFFQIAEDSIVIYHEYTCLKDAPVLILNERTFDHDFVGPMLELRYHARSYDKLELK